MIKRCLIFWLIIIQYFCVIYALWGFVIVVFDTTIVVFDTTITATVDQGGQNVPSPCKNTSINFIKGNILWIWDSDVVILERRLWKCVSDVYIQKYILIHAFNI